MNVNFNNKTDLTSNAIILLYTHIIGKLFNLPMSVYHQENGENKIYLLELLGELHISL